MSTVNVYSPDGEYLSGWGSTEFYVTDLALSPDGKRLAVVGLNARGGKFLTTLTVLRVGYEQALCRIELPDFEPIAVGYVKSGYLFVAGDQKSYAVNPHDFNLTELLTGTVSAFVIDYDSGAAFFSQTSDKQGILTVYETTGGRRFQKDIEMRATGVSLSGSRAAVLGRGEAALFNIGGGQVSPPEIQNGCRAILLLGSNVYLIQNTEIARI